MNFIRSLKRKRYDATAQVAGCPLPLTVEPDAEMFVLLLDECRAKLTRAARCLCRYNEDCVLEMVQAAVVRAFDAYMRGMYTVSESFGAWMVQILTNYFINDYRARTRRLISQSLDEITADGETGPCATYSPESEQPGNRLMAATLDEPLERALNALPEAMRLTVLLVDVHQFSYEEAAKALSVPVGTIRSRLSRARCLLYDLLQEYARTHRIL